MCHGSRGQGRLVVFDCSNRIGSWRHLRRTRPADLHRYADGGLDPNWNPNADGTVDALAISGSTVYVRGNFASIGGMSRNRIAALDAASGAATAWNPNADNNVYALAVSGSTAYVGGGF